MLAVKKSKVSDSEVEKSFEMVSSPIISECSLYGSFSLSKYMLNYSTDGERSGEEFYKEVKTVKKKVEEKNYCKFMDSIFQEGEEMYEISDQKQVAYLQALMMEYLAEKVLKITQLGYKKEVHAIQEIYTQLTKYKFEILNKYVYTEENPALENDIVRLGDILVAFSFDVAYIETTIFYDAFFKFGIEDTIITFFLNKNPTSNEYFIHNLAWLYREVYKLKNKGELVLKVVKNIEILRTYDVVDLIKVFTIASLHKSVQKDVYKYGNLLENIIKQTYYEILTNRMGKQEFNLMDNPHYQNLMVVCVKFIRSIEHRTTQHTEKIIPVFFKDVLRDFKEFSKIPKDSRRLISEKRKELDDAHDILALYTVFFPEEFDTESIKFEISKYFLRIINETPKLMDIENLMRIIDIFIVIRDRKDELLSILISGRVLPTITFKILAQVQKLRNTPYKFLPDKYENFVTTEIALLDLFDKFIDNELLKNPLLDETDFDKYLAFIKKNFDGNSFFIESYKNYRITFAKTLLIGINSQYLAEEREFDEFEVKKIEELLRMCSWCFSYLKAEDYDSLKSLRIMKLIVIESKYFNILKKGPELQEGVEKYLKNVNCYLHLVLSNKKFREAECLHKVNFLMTCFNKMNFSSKVAIVRNLVSFFSDVDFRILKTDLIKIDDVFNTVEIIYVEKMSLELKTILQVMFLVVGSKKVYPITARDRISVTKIIKKTTPMDFFNLSIRELKKSGIPHMKLEEAFDYLNVKLSFEKLIFGHNKKDKYKDFFESILAKSLFSTKEFLLYYRFSFNSNIKVFKNFFYLYSMNRNKYGNEDDFEGDGFIDLFLTNNPKIKFKVGNLAEIAREDLKYFFVQNAIYQTRKHLKSSGVLDFINVKSKPFIFLFMFFSDKIFRDIVSENQQGNDLFIEIYTEFTNNKEEYKKKLLKFFKKKKTTENIEKTRLLSVFWKTFSEFYMRGIAQDMVKTAKPGYKNILDHISADMVLNLQLF